ncbi:MAG: type II toxin-antitoxin system RelE/ParE family toxin [Chryseolinea sp.]
MVGIIWTDHAKDDLTSIFDYISKDSKFYASRYVDKLISRVGPLEFSPRSGRIVPEFNKEEIKELIEGNYRIVYRYRGDTVTVLRIHHSASQLKGL